MILSKTTIAAGLLALSTLAAVPAQASGAYVQVDYRSRHHSYQGDVHNSGVSIDQAGSILRDAGYWRVHLVENRGNVYQMSARMNGVRYMVFISADDGRILGRNRF